MLVVPVASALSCLRAGNKAQAAEALRH